MQTTISILGSTGSIGITTLKIIDKNKKKLKPYLFSANKNLKLICNQINKYKPKVFVISEKKIFEIVKKKYLKKNIIIIINFKSLNLNKKSEITISAIPGIAGLDPTLQMIRFSNRILLANKESIICGWELIKKKSKKHNTILIPIDSEHFSIFKLLEKEKRSAVKRIFITASGGPFLNYSPTKMKKIKPYQALKHPKWKMGKKITIDSSTLMKKFWN